MKINMTLSDVAEHIRKYRSNYILFLVLVLVSMLAYFFYKASRPDATDTQREGVVMPEFVAGSAPVADFQVQPTATLMLAPVTATAPITSNQWRVIENSETIKIKGFVYAVVTFQNVSTMETRKGQCQQPKWSLPEKGHLYTLVNTFNAPNADYWLFIPIEGVSDTTYQRFAPIN